ncbi:DUF4214 domain-containing protein [Oricola cellulosilytica]|uniref:DUF4214 domain-containing protein n=1 Tax=Oricola cellulosilytica TaxID=1429082 RepID=A0A4R0P740_9HYPH|nr:DUF4214 domain-containing protein [Oricola cellulosilytica]TCD11308.1 DUF4214 domain-containing protein [Oricola cellulosilytica]
MSGTGHTNTSVSTTGSQFVDGLLSGVKWGDSTLYYSFPASDAEYDYSGAPATFAPVTSTMQKTAAHFALNTAQGSSANDGFSLEGFTRLNVVHTTTTDAHIRLAQSDDPLTAYAYYPSTGDWGGDVWVGTSYNYTSPQAGNYVWHTHLHEIGHALGLKHGQETSVYGALPSSYDSMEYSVMTYRSYVGDPLSGGYSNETWGYAQTYMMADIAALQHMYGANFAINNGDTVYKWNPSSGDTLVNGAVAINPGANRIFATIWDGGGTDTYDLSTYSTNLTIDLQPGGYSYFGAVQIANLGDGNYARGNIFNAQLYQDDVRSLIENAIGGSGNDTVTGNQANNILTGNSGNDTLYGMGGSDTLVGGDGDDVNDGGAGTDTAAYDSLSRTHSISWSGSNGRGTVSGGGTDSLSSIELLSFVDGYFLSGNAAIVARMYDSALDRDADYGGLFNWIASLDAGLGGIGLAEYFVTSQEFTQTYGALGNTEFVTLLYENVLDRSPDQPGLDYWVDLLDFGSNSRAEVLYGISESVEHISIMASDRVSGSIWLGDDNAMEIARLYNVALDRAPDADGLSQWIASYKEGQRLENIAESFVNSAEFAAKYGSLSHTDFVALLYNNALDREPDQPGLDYWVLALDNGQVTTADMLIGFSNSTEFKVFSESYMDDGIMLA